MDVRLGGQRDCVDAAINLFSLHGIRCLFATAHHTPETPARAEPANPLAWVSKPYDRALLRRGLAYLLGTSRTAFRIASMSEGIVS